MSYLIKMPKMGLEMEEGEVVSWEVGVDEEVDEGDVIAVVESEKSANDVEARENGAVREIVVSEGGVVEPGDPIGVFGGLDEDVSDLLAEIDREEPSEPTAETDGSSTATAEKSGGSASGTSGQATTEIRATPGARDLASEEDVDLGEVEGTGPQGTVTEADVRGRIDGSATGDTDEQASTDVRATPGAKRLAGERDVDLTDVEGTGPQGVVTEDDVERHEPTDTAAESADSDVRATPGAKQLASSRGIDLSAVEGTGPQGVVTEDDVDQHEPESGTVPDSGTRTATRTVRESRSLSGMQQTIGDRMSQSAQAAPHVTLNRSFDASAMQHVSAAADEESVDASLTDLILAGLGAQLAATPAFNALYEDGEHKLVEEVNVGVAVDVDEGLVTPVVPSVATKSVEEIASVRGERTERALSGDFEMSDMKGGTFTVTNLGMFGIDSFDPIINPPEVAILGVGRVRDDGTMTLSLSFDHRVVNGADAARFLDGVVDNLTDSKWLADQFEADVVGALIDILSE